MFKKFYKMRNHYDRKRILKWLEFYPELKDEKFIVTEKLHGCVDWDTEIDTLEFGSIPIGKVVDEEIDCHVKSYDVDSGEVVYEKVLNYQVKEDCGDWFSIETEDGRTLHITGNHLVWLPKLKCWRKVGDLTTEDYFLID